MSLRGSHEVKIDQKGRVVIPSKHRAQLIGDEAENQEQKSNLVITGHPAEYIMLMKGEVYFAHEKTVSDLAVSDGRGLYFRNTFIGLADDSIEPDQLGRIKIPLALRKHAKLEVASKVLIFGMIDHLQLWNEEEWNKLREKVSPGNSEYATPQGWSSFPI